jgi:glycosyltransferase involved in cell wall biosynthesis
MSPTISVVVCTHNPRAEYLNRTLAALRAQTLAPERWELLVIDNASKEAVAPRFDLGWHPNGRHVHEPTLGLTPARLRGVAESRGDPIVFVDDDNLLDPDYLERALEVGAAHPTIGAWGGNIRPEFEVPPAEWAKPHVGMLAILEVARDQWSNFSDRNETVPWGAGMVVRRAVATAYARLCAEDELRRRLDRAGTSLVSSGDCDLALTSCDLGMGTGRFRALALTHLIPAGRLQLDYLVRLAEGGAYSMNVLRAIRGGRAAAAPGLLQRLILFYHRRRICYEHRMIYDAKRRGERRAREVLEARGGPAGAAPTRVEGVTG